MLGIRSHSIPALIGVGILALSGCSGERGAEPDDTAKAESSPSGTLERVLTQDELRSAALTTQDVPGARSIDFRDPLPESTNTLPPVSVASCQTLIDTTNAEGASATVTSIFSWQGDIWPGGSTLASYEGDGAERAFRNLRKALKGCESYSGVSYVGEYDAEVEVEKAPDMGDEALAFRTTVPVQLSGSAEKKFGNTEYVCVRVGTSVAVFDKLSYEGDAEFPRRLIEEQTDLLRKAQQAQQAQ